jgi:hypothetical protein
MTRPDRDRESVPSRAPLPSNATRHRWFLQAAFACAVLILAAAATPARAQTPTADPKWQPWLGCWSSSQNGLTGAASRVCVVPAAGPSAIDIVSLANGKVVSREHLEANGERRTSERDGCKGWETARWSSDSRRVYLKSEFECAAGTKRTSDGLIAMSPQGDWLDIVSVTMSGNTGVRVLRHRPTVEPTDLPADIAASLHSVPAARIRDARVAAIAPIGFADIIDASHQVSAQVVNAWLNDVRQNWSVDAKRLDELADAGVPGSVTDMLIAMAYPYAFSVPPSPTQAGELASNGPGGGSALSGFEPYTPSLDCANAFSEFAFGGCSPYAYSPYAYSPYGYLPFGYLPYSPYALGGIGALGLGYGYGYGGWYNTAPVVIVRPGGDNVSHGQVVNGRGYRAGGNQGTATATGNSGGSVSSGGGSSSSGGGGAGTGASTAGGGGGGGGDRTAHPR